MVLMPAVVRFALLDECVQALEAIFGLETVNLKPDFFVECSLESLAVVAEQSVLRVAQWKWSEEEGRNGSAEDVAEAVRSELEAKADW